MAANIDAQVVPLAKSIIGAADHATSFLSEAEARVELRPGEPLQVLNQTLVDARKLINDVDASWPQIVTPAVLALKTAAGAFTRADTLMKTAQATLSPASPAYFEVLATLREFRIRCDVGQGSGRISSAQPKLDFDWKSVTVRPEHGATTSCRRRERHSDRECRQNSCVANEILVTHAAAWTALERTEPWPPQSKIAIDPGQ